MYRCVYGGVPKDLDEMIDNLIPIISISSMIALILPQDVVEKLNVVKSKLRKIAEGSKFAKDLTKVIELGEVLYIYSVDKASSLIVKLFQGCYRGYLRKIIL